MDEFDLQLLARYRSHHRTATGVLLAAVFLGIPAIVGTMFAIAMATDVLWYGLLFLILPMLGTALKLQQDAAYRLRAHQMMAD